MKVGVFVAFSDNAASGHVTYQASLVNALLAQRRHEIVLVAANHESTPTAIPPHGIARYRPIHRFGFNGFGTAVRLFASPAVRRSGVDVLIGNGNWAMPRPRGIPRIVVVYEGMIEPPVPWGLYHSGFVRKFDAHTRRALSDAVAAIAISEHTASHVKRLRGWDDKPIVVAHPALLPFPESPIDRLDVPPYVMAVGWFHARKDLPLTLRAWARANEHGLDHDLVLVGDLGPDDPAHGSVGRRILENAGEALASRVHVLGPVSRARLGQLLRGASALLMSSYHEGFGIPALEAFSIGTPVVAVARGALPEAVGSVGAVVEPHADAMADGILRVVGSPPDADGLIAYARTFTPQRQTAPILELLDRLEST